MSAEDRLMRALAASEAPKRDPRFTIAVLEAAERERYRVERVRTALHGAGVAGACAALLLPLGNWIATHASAVSEGTTWAVGILAVVSLVRLVAPRNRVEAAL